MRPIDRIALLGLIRDSAAISMAEAAKALEGFEECMETDEEREKRVLVVGGGARVGGHVNVGTIGHMGHAVAKAFASMPFHETGKGARVRRRQQWMRGKKR